MQSLFVVQAGQNFWPQPFQQFCASKQQFGQLANVAATVALHVCVYALRCCRVCPVTQLSGGRRSRESNKSPARLSPQPVCLMSAADLNKSPAGLSPLPVSLMSTAALSLHKAAISSWSVIIVLCCSASAAAWAANLLRNSADSACALRAMSAHCVVSSFAAARRNCRVLTLLPCRPECEGGRPGRFLTLHAGRFCTFGMLCWLVAVFGLEPWRGSGHCSYEKQDWLPDHQNWNPESYQSQLPTKLESTYQTNKTGIPNPTIVAPKDVSQHN